MADNVGGQAVMEGVMMRRKDKIAIAVRKENVIKVRKQPFNSISNKYKFLKMPFFRGIVNLIEMMIIGLKALTWSADQQSGEDEKIKPMELLLTFGIAIALTIGLFVLFPLFLTKLFIKSHGLIFNLIDGVIRIMIFISYIYLISMMSDIKRIFQYHGAEHMAVHCYEAKKELTIENCKKFGTAHLRCGTSFLVIVMAISILLFSIIKSPNFLVKFATRIIFIPIVIGVSYELLKVFEKYHKNKLVKLIAAPGLWVQSLTTKKPDDKQLMVAIRALEAVS